MENATGHKILDNFVSTETGTGLETKETRLSDTETTHQGLHTMCWQRACNTTSIDTEQEPVMGAEDQAADQHRELKDGDDKVPTRMTRVVNTGDLVEFFGGSSSAVGSST